MRQPKPFFRKQTQSWYLRLGKQFIPLGKDKEAAFDEYHAIMDKRAKGQIQAEGSVAKILDLYWQWCDKNLARTTADRRKKFLKSFGLHLGAKFPVRRLRPFHVQE
jgi:hypothetical protein